MANGSKCSQGQRVERIEKCLDLVTRRLFMALGMGEEPVWNEFKREEEVRKGRAGVKEGNKTLSRASCKVRGEFSETPEEAKTFTPPC